MPPLKFTASCPLFDMFQTMSYTQSAVRSRLSWRHNHTPRPTSLQSLMAFTFKSGQTGPVPSSSAFPVHSQPLVTAVTWTPQTVSWRSLMQTYISIYSYSDGVVSSDWVDAKPQSQQYLQVQQQHQQSHKETKGSLNLSMQARPSQRTSRNTPHPVQLHLNALSALLSM